jgi:hypothetical protein
MLSMMLIPAAWEIVKYRPRTVETDPAAHSIQNERNFQLRENEGRREPENERRVKRA